MLKEKEYVCHQFVENFCKIKRKRLAIYGLGANTKALLDSFGEDYPIVALMDGTRTGEIIWGLPVVTCDEAKSMGVEEILILARASNLAIIYRRIESDCDRLGIPVYDISGKRIEKPSEEDKKLALAFYTANGEEQLKAKIDRCDVISFDIFDTLLMRSVLYPEDIFWLLEKRAVQDGLLEPWADFAKRRQSAERELYLKGQPTIQDIYGQMVRHGDIQEDKADLLLDMELQEELDHILPRQSMVAMLQYAQSSGKAVCCTSDMYLPKEILAKLLEKCGVEQVDRILVSCEAGCHKGNGLFAILREHYPKAKILHVGDNEDADIKSAQRYGIDDTFPVHSAMKMLEDSAAGEMLKLTNGLDDRLEVGRFLAHYLENPFLFERTKGKLEIKSAYAMGWDFLAPMMTSFMNWLVERCTADKIEMLILGARDGWMMTKLLDRLSQIRQLPFEYRYVPASRTACTLAGMKTMEDVEFAVSQPFSGTAVEMLCKRFLLKEDELLPREAEETDREYILRHSKLLLEKAEINRQNYRDMLEDKGIKAGQKKAYFDFVSSGTCQFWMEKIWGEKLQGYCYARFILPGKECLDMEAFMTEVFSMQIDTNCHLLENYFLVEAFISAPAPFLLLVRENGELLHDEEKRSQKFIEQIKDAQRGIMDRFNEGLCDGTISIRLTDFLAGLMEKKYSFMDKEKMNEAKLVDEFCNREFQMNSFF